MLLWKFSNQIKFCGNLSQRQFFGEICHKGIFRWKLAMKPTFCGNFQQGGISFYGNFSTKQNIFLLKFSMKTVQHLEGILQQNSVNFAENFRKIHQTAKISAQQRCHAARVFVTLLYCQWSFAPADLQKEQIGLGAGAGGWCCSWTLEMMWEKMLGIELILDTEDKDQCGDTGPSNPPLHQSPSEDNPTIFI